MSHNPLKKNMLAEVTVTDMNDMGYGVARTDGVVTFVAGGVTGDLLSVRIIKVAADYAVARIENVLAPSPHRVEPDCPVFKRCGGCSFRNVTREYELELKRGFVTSAFRKQRLDVTVNPVVTDGRADGYRNKVQYPVAPDGTYGYYAPHSHDIIPCDACALGDPAFVPITRFVGDFIRKNKIKVKHIYLRRAGMTGETMLCLVVAEPKIPNEKEFVSAVTAEFPEIKSIVLNINPEDTNVILGHKTKVIYGTDLIEDVLCGCRFGISSLSFYQVNRGVAELLYNEAIRLAYGSKPKNVADLYCGAGTIGLSFAKAHPEISVRGVEIVPEAIENARRNAMLNGIGNAEFVCADAVTADLTGIDCVLIDPPRKGMSRELTDRLCGSGIRNIVYVSCEPTTLARDAAILTEAGYRISDVTPFDMFPRTTAVETVVKFSKE